MVPVSTICQSPFYWGEISLEETISVLEKERKHSYLMRKLKNGSITLAVLSRIQSLLKHFFIQPFD